MTTSKSTDFTLKVFSLVKKIPFGKVSTYKEIAKALGKPNSSRAVGNALNKNKEFEKINCSKVIKSNGLLGGYALGKKEKQKKLEKEGIQVEKGKINLQKYLFKF